MGRTRAETRQAHHLVRLQVGWPRLGQGWHGAALFAKNSLEHSTPITFPEDETFDIGQDTRTPLPLVEYRYDVPFKFTGKIEKLTFNLEPTLALSPGNSGK